MKQALLMLELTHKAATVLRRDRDAQGETPWVLPACCKRAQRQGQFRCKKHCWCPYCNMPHLPRGSVFVIHPFIHSQVFIFHKRAKTEILREPEHYELQVCRAHWIRLCIPYFMELLQGPRSKRQRALAMEHAFNTFRQMRREKRSAA